MKKIMLATLATALLVASLPAMAQEDVVVIGKEKDKEKNKEKKETQEIIIRKKGDKEVNVTVEIKGDKVMINGKPAAEFKDDNISVNTRKIVIRDGRALDDQIRSLNGRFKDMDLQFKELGELYKMKDFQSLSPSWNGNNMQFWGDGDGKEVKRTFLGVTTEENDKGAKIMEVNEGSAADKAGLKKDDIISKVGDKAVTGPESLSKAITALKPKDEVKITYTRDGKEKTTKATLDEKVERNVRVYSMTSPRAFGGDELRVQGMPRFNRDQFGGAQDFENFSRDIQVMGMRRPKIGLKLQDTEDVNGVKVLDIDEESPAEKAGLKKDDIITSIDGKAVNNTDEAREALKPAEGKKTYAIKAKRNGSEMSFDVKIPVKLKTADF